VSSRKTKRAVGKHKRPKAYRGRKVATVTGTALLVAAAVAGEPSTVDPSAVAGGAGGGLHGLTDPDSVSANGQVGDEDKIGDEVLDAAGDMQRLREMGPTGDLPNGPLMIPSDLYKAYTHAAQLLATELPTCHVHWSLLASIGRIESNHARGGQVDNAGNTVPHILGPVLNGGGFAAIRDTDHGSLDDDARWDRAVGAMQFIPSTWTKYASDGNNDGVQSPHNIYDATVAAGKFLCSGGMDLSDPKDRALAVFRYNHSDSYVRTVLIWADAYASGVQPLPTTPVNPAQLVAMHPPKAHAGAHRPGAHSGPAPGHRPPGSGDPDTSHPPSSPPSSSSSRPPSSTSSSSCAPTSTTTSTTTTTTTPPPSSTTTTTTPTCPTSPPPSSASSSAPAGSAGSSVVPTT
jgi:transglycosylase-like protein with SLT domain